MDTTPSPAPASPEHELSVLVAERWMGWRRSATGWRRPDDDRASVATDEPRFAQDARLASEALALARRRGFHCTVRVLRSSPGDPYEVAIVGAAQRHSSRGRTLPEAACRALIELCANGADHGA